MSQTGQFSTSFDDAELLAQAVAADQAATDQVELASIWLDLVEGNHVVVGGFFTPQRCALLLRRDAHAAPTGRRLSVLSALLSGTCQKRLAIELSLAPSTVSTAARTALEQLGVLEPPSRVHPLLMLAAAAATERRHHPASSCFVETSGGTLRVVGVARPDRALCPLLPEAERHVASLLLQGHSYASIACMRGTARRTIANQIAAVFRRLRVSGRGELVFRMFALQGVADGAHDSYQL